MTASDRPPPAGPSGPLDRVLDVVLYAPLGLALLARDELPRLAARGRERVSTQADLARMVGQLAVAQGRRQAQDVVGRLTRAGGETGVTTVEPAPASRPVPVRDLGADERLPEPTGETVPDVAAVPLDPPSPPAPRAGELPIPGYDSLSASQVVQRLAGLSPEELEAVRSYEQAGRARKTVLLRVAQLRAAS